MCIYGLRSKNYYSYLDRKTFMLMLVLYLAEKKTKSVFIRKVDSLFGILFIYCKERKCTLGLWFSASLKNSWFWIGELQLSFSKVLHKFNKSSTLKTSWFWFPVTIFYVYKQQSRRKSIIIGVIISCQIKSDYSIHETK